MAVEQPTLDPAADRVVTDAEVAGGFANPHLRHCRHPSHEGSAAKPLIVLICGPHPPRLDESAAGAATAALVVGPPDNGGCPGVASTLGAHQRQCQPPTSGGSTHGRIDPHRAGVRHVRGPRALPQRLLRRRVRQPEVRLRRTPGTHPSPAPSTPSSDGRPRAESERASGPDRYALKILSIDLPLASSSTSLSR